MNSSDTASETDSSTAKAVIRLSSPGISSVTEITGKMAARVLISDEISGFVIFCSCPGVRSMFSVVRRAESRIIPIPTVRPVSSHRSGEKPADARIPSVKKRITG